MGNKRSKFKDHLIFLLPGRVITSEHLSKKDVRKIKENLAITMSTIYIIIAAFLLVILTALCIYMNVNSGFNFTSYYGWSSLVGQIVVLGGITISLILLIISKTLKKDSRKALLSRIGSIALYLSISTYMLLCIHSDALMGFTKNQEVLSASVIIVTILILLQSPYWIEAAILNIETAFCIAAIAGYCKIKYNMGGSYYYGIIALFFPLLGYAIMSLLFYAESRHYKDMLEKERLTNTAYYDNLTHCKNRYALEEFINENLPRWQLKRDNANLLMILFDIDDFKLYNDHFSHLGGDYCLISITEAVRNKFPSPSLDFFRFGGEEFLLFFELRNPSDSKILLKELKDSIKNLKIIAPKGAPNEFVTISIGAKLIKNCENFTFEKEFSIIDGYLYKAKESGKDAIVLNGDLVI